MVASNADRFLVAEACDAEWSGLHVGDSKVRKLFLGVYRLLRPPVPRRRQRLRVHSGIYGLFRVAAQGVGPPRPFNPRQLSHAGGSLFLLVLPLMLVIFETLSIYFRIGFRRPGIYRRIFSARHVAHAMSGTVLLMAMMLFMGSFTSVKNVLPIIGGGFPFDKVLADFDRWLHLGNQPFKLLSSVIGSPVVLGFLQWNYTVMWFMLSFGALFSLSFRREQQRSAPGISGFSCSSGCFAVTCWPACFFRRGRSITGTSRATKSASPFSGPLSTA